MTVVTAHRASVQRRTLGTLMAGQALGGVGVTTGIAVASILAEDILGTASLAGLAQTAQVLGAAVGAFVLARLMSARGRRVGLVAGYAVGAAGAALCVVAGVAASFAVLLLGTFAIGWATAANSQARYAATDLAEPHRRARALALVVWATTLGAVLGPNLAGPGAALARRLGVPELTGPFVFTIVAVGLATLVLTAFLRPDPLLLSRRLAAGAEDARTGTGGAGVGARQGAAAAGQVSLRRVWTVVSAAPKAAAAMTAIGVAHAVMVSVMVMTPLHMHHGDASLEVIGFVISVHILGMFAFSPLVGWLADRAGRAVVLASGGGLLLGAVLLAGRSPEGHSTGLLWGLFLLGLGWSCCLIAGSTLLVDAVPFAERPAVQGASDLVMGLFAAGGGALAGLVVEVWGYDLLNVGSGVLALVVLGAAAVARRETPERRSV
jgi:MFS family permease